MKAKKFKLKNGLSVLLLENHKSPVVSVQMWVSTGSADESKPEAGISHFIEHLVFKGTRKYGLGEIASTVEASGGELNAYTSFDQTVFYVTISKEFAGVGLDVISEMMGFPQFDSKEIDNEREVVIEEIRRSNDSPSRQASRMLFSTSYAGHPYSVPVIGYDKIIKNVSRKTIMNYYTSRYVPRNMQLVIAGDFEMAKMVKDVTKVYGELKDFKLRKVKRAKLKKQTKSQLKVEQTKFKETQFHMAFKVPGAAHKDTAALDVLALILGQGDSSRLGFKLRMENPLTNSIGASTFTPKEAGLFTISGSLNPEQIEPAFNAMSVELERIMREAPHADELKKAVTNFEADEFYGMETVDAIARKAGSLENLMGDYKYFEKYLKNISALQPADIQKAALKYLDPSTMTLVMMTTQDKAKTTVSLRSWMKSYAKTFAQAKVGKKVPAQKMKTTRMKLSMSKAVKVSNEPEKIVLDSGATLIFKPNYDTPVVSVKAGFLGGLRVEDESQLGVTEMLSRLWTSGAKGLTENDITTKMEAIASHLSAFGGRNSAGLTLQMLSAFEKDALAMFEAVLTEPEISEAALKREKIMMLEELRLREDNPGQLVSQLFIEKMFAGHPYHKDMQGTRATVEALSVKSVMGHLQKMRMANNLVLVVAGAADRKLWIDRMEKATSKFKGGKRLETSFTHKSPERAIHAFKHLQKEQTHIIYGYKGLTLSDPRRYALQVIQSVLAGQGGRLFMELRDKASLAYSVSPMRMEGIDTGYFGGYIGCAPDKAETAISMMQAEFMKLVDTPLSDIELARAKKYLIGRHDIDLQRNAAIASSILFNELYGIELNEPFKYAENLRAVDQKQVQQVAKMIFAQNSVITAVGAREPKWTKQEKASSSQKDTTAEL